ncbi:MAG TPA: hypothetical protein VGR37_13965 [Longimicrobiaceae bacterium]|nr:hypothetical protein [Longimicrobiaceae bacterium]
MQTRVSLLALLLGVSACSIPFTTSSEERKAPCDRLAARAIQTSSLEDAKNLAAQASGCYARAQGD